MAAVPLLGTVQAGATGHKIFSTGLPEIDRALGGGIRAGSVLVVAGPRGSGKTAFLLRLAKANGIMDAYPMGNGTSDMLSIMEREDGKHLGSLMLDAVEPSTDKEKADMAVDPAARGAFLTRWFKRTQDVIRDSGGVFAISICETVDRSSKRAWMDIPHYVISVNQSEASILRAPQ